MTLIVTAAVTTTTKTYTNINIRNDMNNAEEIPTRKKRISLRAPKVAISL